MIKTKEKVETKYIFVYGTLKRGFRLNPLLEKSKYIKDYILVGHDLYELFFKEWKSQSYPVMVEGSGMVKGEIWKVPIETFECIDWIEKRAGYKLYKKELPKFIPYLYFWAFDKEAFRKFKKLLSKNKTEKLIKLDLEFKNPIRHLKIKTVLKKMKK